MSNLRYQVVVHDFHGAWTNHPERAVQSFEQTWRQVFAHAAPDGFTLQFLNRPPDYTVKEMARKLVRQEMGVGWGDEFVRVLMEKFEHTYIPHPRLEWTIRELSRMGVEQVVLSNGQLSIVRQVIEEWGLLPLMRAVYGKENTPQNQFDRPKPRIDLLTLLLRAGISEVPEKVLFFGDYEDDLMTAVRNGTGSAILIVGSCQIYPPHLIEKNIYPDHLLLEPAELVPIVQGEDVGFAERLQQMKTTGLGTRITDLWQNQ